MKTLIILLFTCIYVHTNGQMATNKWIIYENTKYGYKFSYPSSWKIKGTPEEYSIYAISEDGKQTEPEIFFTVLRNDNDSSWEYMQKLEKIMLKSLKGSSNFQLKSSAGRFLSGKPGLFMDFSNTKNNNDTERLHSMIWQINKGAYVFRLMYRGKSDMDSKYLADAFDVFNSFSFLSEPPRFNRPLMRGRWEGTITENLPNATNIKPYPFTIIFKNYNESKRTLTTIQIVNNFNTNKIDTVYRDVEAATSDEGMLLLYSMGLPDKKQCSIKLYLFYNIKNGSDYLIGHNSTEGVVCFNVNLLLKKVSEETELLIPKQNTVVNKTTQPKKENIADKPQINSSEEVMLHAGARLFETIRILPDNDEAKGAVAKINITEKEKVSILKHSALKLSSDGKKFIDNETEQPFEVEINVFDLNNDGTYELVLWKHNRTGPQGMSEYTIYYNTHEPSFYIPILTTTGFPVPRKEKIDNFASILNSGPGLNRPLYRWDGYKYKYAGLAPDREEAINESGLVGGSTPEELGKQLLKALQTNDFKLWQGCQHPTEIKYKDYNEFRFKQCREKLESAGLTNWNLVKFSRVTYQKGDPPSFEGDLIKAYFVIEFTYNNNQFLGALGQMTIMTYKQNKYFLVKQWEGAGLMRNKK